MIPHTDNVPGGVAVRAATFGQCIDAVRALDVEWGPGTVDGKSDADVLADLVAAELPLHAARCSAQTLEQRFTFHFRPATRSRPTAPSPTCAPTAPRSGRA